MTPVLVILAPVLVWSVVVKLICPTCSPGFLAATGVSPEMNVKIQAESRERGTITWRMGPSLGPAAWDTPHCKAESLERSVWLFRKMRFFRVRALALDLEIYYFKGDNVYVENFFQIVHKNIKQKVIYPSSPTSISPIGAHQRCSLLGFLCTCAYVCVCNICICLHTLNILNNIIYSSGHLFPLINVYLGKIFYFHHGDKSFNLCPITLYSCP